MVRVWREGKGRRWNASLKRKSFTEHAVFGFASMLLRKRNKDPLENVSLFKTLLITSSKTLKSILSMKEKLPQKCRAM